MRCPMTTSCAETPRARSSSVACFVGPSVATGASAPPPARPDIVNERAWGAKILSWCERWVGG